MDTVNRRIGGGKTECVERSSTDCTGCILHSMYFLISFATEYTVCLHCTV